MEKITKNTSRRVFLRRLSGTIAASSFGVAGWSNIPWGNNRRSDLTLFSEGQIGSLTLKNRLIRAAASAGAYPDGKPTETYLNIYKSYAAGGAGLILAGAMKISSTGMNLIRASDDVFIPELGKIANAVHSMDDTCKVMAQLWHKENAGPSGIPWPGDGTIGTLTVEQIQDRIRKFSEAIRRVRDAGFDGAELNAHYTYFLSSFLSPLTNKRTDGYGGTVEKRVRIVKEIVEQARAKVGSDFPIMIKVNCDDSFDPDVPSVNGTNLDNFHLLAAELEKAGVDAVELSGNSLARTGIDSIDDQSYFSAYSEKLDVSIPVILTGGNRTLDLLEEIIHRDKVDFFGMARPLIREPDLPRRWLEGESVGSTCISCNKCLGVPGPIRCHWTIGVPPDHPAGVRIFPNPVKDILYIELPEILVGEISVAVSDLKGSIISTVSGHIKQLDLSALKKGSYLITIRSESFESNKQIIKI